MTSKEELKILKDNVIIDTFFVEGMEIAVINPEAINNDGTPGFGKIIVEGNDSLLVPLSDEEYTKAANKYSELFNLFIGGDE